MVAEPFAAMEMLQVAVAALLEVLLVSSLLALYRIASPAVAVRVQAPACPPLVITVRMYGCSYGRQYTESRS